jgi:hypothetical protein
MHRLLGVPWIAEHQPANRLEAGPMPIEQNAERPLVAPACGIEHDPFFYAAVLAEAR